MTEVADFLLRVGIIPAVLVFVLVRLDWRLQRLERIMERLEVCLKGRLDGTAGHNR